MIYNIYHAMYWYTHATNAISISHLFFFPSWAKVRHRPLWWLHILPQLPATPRRGPRRARRAAPSGADGAGRAAVGGVARGGAGGTGGAQVTWQLIGRAMILLVSDWFPGFLWRCFDHAQDFGVLKPGKLVANVNPLWSFSEVIWELQREILRKPTVLILFITV